MSRDPFIVVSTLQVTSIDLKDPVTKEPQSVTNLADPLEVTFNGVSPPPDGKKFGCNFFDPEKQAWVQTDLTLEDTGNNTLVCKSNHLTIFAPSHDALTNASTAATTPTVEGMDRLIYIVFFYDRRWNPKYNPLVTL